MATIEAPSQQLEGKRGWRYYVGLLLFVLHLILPVLALIFVPMLGLSGGINALLYGLSVAGGPDLLLIASAALLGKDDLQYLFSKLGSWFKNLVKWDQVSPQRYKVGLWMMVVSVIITVISANAQVTNTEIVVLAAMLLVVMGINLMALLFVDKVMKYLSPEVLGVANRILALLLAALAMETIINGLRELGIAVNYLRLEAVGLSLALRMDKHRPGSYPRLLAC
jgi:small neutral amino acid transporter SnatA (MarC family)